MTRSTIAILLALSLVVVVMVVTGLFNFSCVSTPTRMPTSSAPPPAGPPPPPPPPRYHAELDGVTSDGSHLVSSVPARVSLWISAAIEPRAGLGNWPVNPTLLEQQGIVPLKVHLVCSVCPERPSEEPITFDTAAGQSTRATFSIVADRRLADADGAGLVTFLVFSGGQLLDRLIAPVHVDSQATAPVPTARAILPTEGLMSAIPNPDLSPDLIIAVGTTNNRVHVGVTAVTDWAKQPLSQMAGTTFVERQFPNGPRFGEIKGPIEHAFDGLKELMEKDPAHRPVLSAMQAQGPAFSQSASDHMSDGEHDGTVSVLSQLGTPLYDALFRSDTDSSTLFNWIEQIPRPPDRPLRVQIQASEFQVPWALLRPVGSTSVDDFWGFKYELSVVIIDQISATSPVVNDGDGKLARVLYAGLPGDVADSLGAISDGQFDYLKKAMGTITPLDMRKRDDFLAAIRTHHNALQLIFAFVHGTDGIVIGPSGAVSASSVGLALLFKLDDINEALTPDAFRSLRIDLKLPPALQLFASHPIVILDACESGLASADRSSADPAGGFPYTLLKAGSSAVVATDAPVWGQLARSMGDLLIDGVIKGTPVPRTVHEARLALRKGHHNPLGLVYVAYSLPDAKLLVEKGGT